MDIADKAAEQEHWFLQDALLRQQDKTTVGASLSHCDDCGEAIPLARQQAIVGVRLCVDCQAYRERLG